MVTSSSFITQRVVLLLCLVNLGLSKNATQSPGKATQNPENSSTSSGNSTDSEDELTKFCLGLNSSTTSVSLIGVWSSKLLIFDNSNNGFTVSIDNLNTKYHNLSLGTPTWYNAYTLDNIPTTARNFFSFNGRQGMLFALAITEQSSTFRSLEETRQFTINKPLTASGEFIFSSWYNPPWYGLVDSGGQQCLMTAKPNIDIEKIPDTNAKNNNKLNFTTEHLSSCVQLPSPISRGINTDDYMFAFLQSKDIAIIKRTGSTIKLIETKKPGKFYDCTPKHLNIWMLLGALLALLLILLLLFLLWLCCKKKKCCGNNKPKGTNTTKPTKTPTKKTKKTAPKSKPKSSAKSKPKSSKGIKTSKPTKATGKPKSSGRKPDGRSVKKKKKPKSKAPKSKPESPPASLKIRKPR